MVHRFEITRASQTHTNSPLLPVRQS